MQMAFHTSLARCQVPMATVPPPPASTHTVTKDAAQEAKSASLHYLAKQ